jgi:hypothetical protein
MYEDILDALIVAGVLAVLALIILILKAALEKRTREGPDQVLASDKGLGGGEPAKGDEPQAPLAPPRQESETQRLTRVEKELAGREAKTKGEKLKELLERERLIRMRNEESAQEPAKASQPQDELVGERARVEELIAKAEERFNLGELEEKNFKKIVSDYQEQIIDIDVKLRNKRQPGF